MSEEDKFIFKPPSLRTQIILTHIQGYDSVTMHPSQERGIFSHISYIKKEDIPAKKDEKKRIHKVTILLCKTPTHFSARSSLNYEILSDMFFKYVPYRV